jgi:hypothetical protein
MGKKSRRARARAKAKARARGEQGAVGELTKSTPVERIYTTAPKIEPKAAVPSVASTVTSVQATRYQYILPELRLIGIISGALLLILIILSFVLS